MSDSAVKTLRVCFLGSMNCLTFWYALELRRLGHYVAYFVDHPPGQALHRPECHLSDICYPYPSWIKEISKPRRTFVFYLPFSEIRIFAKRLNHESFDMVVTTDVWHQIIPHMSEKTVRVCFFSGSDLEVRSSYKSMLKLGKNLSFLNLLRIPLRCLETYLLRSAIREADAVNYFPRGALPSMDTLIDKIFKNKQFVQMNSRGVSPHKAPPLMRSVRAGSGVVILSTTRHLWKEPLPLGFSSVENKGNDIMLRGIWHFYKAKKVELVVHLFEKGPNVIESKRLASELGLEKLIVWHQECSPIELAQFYADADIVIDQLGDHMLGDSGVIGLLARKPVIANSHANSQIRNGRDAIPICEAETEYQVAAWLEQLVFNPELREELGRRGQEFLLATNSSLTTANELVGLVGDIHR